jgi:hypothetical protein
MRAHTFKLPLFPSTPQVLAFPFPQKHFLQIRSNLVHRSARHCLWEFRILSFSTLAREELSTEAEVEIGSRSHRLSAKVCNSRTRSSRPTPPKSQVLPLAKLYLEQITPQSIHRSNNSALGDTLQNDLEKFT